MKTTDLDALLERAEMLSDAIRYVESVDVDAAYRKGVRKAKDARRKRIWDRSVKAAACLSVPFLAAAMTLGWLYFFPEREESFASVSSPSGAVVRYELPDRSVVWLNSGSSLRFPTSFGKRQREVELDGEAYFSVEANPDRPFYVRASDGLSVKVYGTKFNVSAYREDSVIQTTLETGCLDVAVTDSGIMTLQPGEQAEYDKSTGQLLKHKVNTYEHTAWKDGKTVLRNASLEEVFRELERRFGVTFKVSGKFSSEDRYRATFRDETLVQIMDYLSKSAGFRWRLEDSGTESGETLPDRTVIVEMKNY